ncbi:hypothetical protein CROQUDRAFT_468170 [Cronartium quercuum f. sp. fusiforme G11]|uniref:Uncharacterized protein n=1 Tax=Cronartium quercuum f. sp. fusiforme G11 TaxID=708437 RepID=A0A9P6TCK7_9BASI|nr:hypothetical protein CROQUDRAFT_468170 [Cronartium quercuum f. sp. fusiforme G11]
MTLEVFFSKRIESASVGSSPWRPEPLLRFSSKLYFVVLVCSMGRTSLVACCPPTSRYDRRANVYIIRSIFHLFSLLLSVVWDVGSLSW